MMTIISSAILLFVIVIVTIEQLHTNRCHAAYQRKFAVVTKEDRLTAIAEELTDITGIDHITTHGCVICRQLKQLFILTEATARLDQVRVAPY